MQLRRLAALERQKIIDRLAELELDDRRPRGHPGQRGAAAADRQRRARRDRGEVRRRAAYPDHRGRRRPLDGGPDPRRGARRLDHPRRLRQAHPRRPVPHPEARRQGRARRDACAATTSSSTSSRRPTTTGCCSSPPPAGSTAPRPTTCPRPRATRRAATSPGCCRFQPDEDIAQVLAIRDYEQAPVPRARHPQRPGQEDPARRLQQPAPGRRHRDQLPRGRRRADRRRAGRRPTTTSCWSPARASRSGSAPTTPSCGRWAAPRPASRA